MIRRAEPRDLEAVNKLLRQVLQVHHAGRPDLFRAEGKKYSDEELLSIFACDDTPVFVYEEEDGKVTGYVFCVFKWQESGCLTPRLSLYIDDLCVDEQARGHETLCLRAAFRPGEGLPQHRPACVGMQSRRHRVLPLVGHDAAIHIDGIIV